LVACATADKLEQDLLIIIYIEWRIGAWQDYQQKKDNDRI